MTRWILVLLACVALGAAYPTDTPSGGGGVSQLPAGHAVLAPQCPHPAGAPCFTTCQEAVDSVEATTGDRVVFVQPALYTIQDADGSCDIATGIFSTFTMVFVPSGTIKNPRVKPRPVIVGADDGQNAATLRINKGTLYGGNLSASSDETELDWPLEIYALNSNDAVRVVDGLIVPNVQSTNGTNGWSNRSLVTVVGDGKDPELRNVLIQAVCIDAMTTQTSIFHLAPLRGVNLSSVAVSAAAVPGFCTGGTPSLVSWDAGWEGMFSASDSTLIAPVLGQGPEDVAIGEPEHIRIIKNRLVADQILLLSAPIGTTGDGTSNFELTLNSEVSGLTDVGNLGMCDDAVTPCNADSDCGGLCNLVQSGGSATFQGSLVPPAVLCVDDATEASIWRDTSATATSRLAVCEDGVWVGK